MLGLCVLTLLLTGAGAAGILNEPDWGFQSYLDQDFTLTCNHSDLMAEPYNYVRWELPDKTMLMGGTEKFALSGGDSVINMHLTIRNVQEADSGVYLCHIYNNAAEMRSRGRLLRGLNVGGHMYREAFDEYRYSLMVGGLAALAIFIPLVTACFVYKFRFQTKEEKREKHAATLEAHQRHMRNQGNGTELSGVAGEVNPGYDADLPGTKNTRL